MKLSPELIQAIEDERSFLEYVGRQFFDAVISAYYEALKVQEYEIVYGEGSYEELIFGGGAGL